MSPLTPIYFENPAEKYEIIISTNPPSIPSRITPLYLKPGVLSGYNHDIHLYHVLNVKNQKIIVLNKKIRKSDSRKIAKIKTTSGIIKKKEKIYIINNNTSEC